MYYFNCLHIVSSEPTTFGKTANQTTIPEEILTRNIVKMFHLNLSKYPCTLILGPHMYVCTHVYTYVVGVFHSPAWRI